jgi:glycyl-tRNA synthetase alpha subunit
MSISEQIATSLRYCQEILVVCETEGVGDDIKYGLIFSQGEGEFNKYLYDNLTFDVEDFEGSDHELILEVEKSFKQQEEGLLVMHNKLRVLDKDEP